MTSFVIPPGWRVEKLTRVATLKRGTEPGSRSYCAPTEGTKFVRVGDISAKIRDQVNTLADDIVLCRNTDILMAFDGSPGIVARGFEGAISSGIRIVEPDESEVLSDYLYFYLQSSRVQETVRKFSTGTVIKHAAKAIPNIEILLPPLSLQQKIATVLTLAAELRAKRADTIQFTNRLIESVFLHLVGDPIDNPKGWEKAILGDVCAELYRYPTFYGFGYRSEGVPVIRIGDILEDGTLDDELSHYVFIDRETAKKFPKTIVERNDILMAVRGDGSTGKVGRVSTDNLVGGITSPNIIRMKADGSKVNPLYLFYLLSSRRGQALIARRITRTAKKKITAAELKDMEILVPPMRVQRNFAQAAEALEKNRKLKLESLREIDSLFQSLVHKAFTGCLRLAS